MKKNKAMRLASLLLILTLLSTSVISGTFAKYVTTATGSDEARVAYWGFDSDADLMFDLFDSEYKNVLSSGEVDGFTNVIAPGTSKTDTFAFSYTNYQTDKIVAPEVAYTFEVVPTVTGNYTDLDNNENFYWTLQAPVGATKKYQTVDELKAAIKKLSGDDSGIKTYAAGELPSAFTAADEKYTIGWVWDFHNSDAGDVADTAMGNSQDLNNVTLTITITATQVN